MSPEEKAKEIFEFYSNIDNTNSQALYCVDQIMWEVLQYSLGDDEDVMLNERVVYWKKVKLLIQQSR